jgi:hypothetical protein
MTNIIWLQNWFHSQCDEDWEHEHQIVIQTIDNPGWNLIIDINDTIWKDLNTSWVFFENNETDWYGYKCENGIFNASGDLKKLDFLINLFRKFIENNNFN